VRHRDRLQADPAARGQVPVEIISTEQIASNWPSTSR
jgi:hypothetical protein